MSIATDVSRIKGNISAALAAIADKGVTVPEGSTSDALASLIASIEAGGGGNIASGTVSWATVPSRIVSTEFVHDLGVVPKLILICPAFDVIGTPSKNIGLYSISTGSLGMICRYAKVNGITLYSNASNCVIEPMSNYSSTSYNMGVYADETKFIQKTYLDSVFTVTSGDVYNWIAVG